MLTLDSLATVAEPPAAETKALRWALPTRIFFRFAVVYFGLYVFCTQMIRGLIVLPGFDLPPWETMWPFRTMVEWTAASVFKVTQPLVLRSGSGDKTFDWVQAFCLLIIAAAATIAWCVVARRRESHLATQKWFRLFLRFALGSTFVSYGAAKVQHRHGLRQRPSRGSRAAQPGSAAGDALASVQQDDRSREAGYLRVPARHTLSASRLGPMHVGRRLRSLRASRSRRRLA